MPDKSPKKLRAILFPAVSTPEQAKDEKASLEAQEAYLRSIGERDNWEIIEVLKVPGFSRVYFNWPDFAIAAANDKDTPTNAGLKMIEHWESRDFDVLAIFDASRLGREQGILAEAVGRTIAAGAQLYSTTEGYINEENHRMFTASAGMRVATEIDIFKKRTKFGMMKRASNGFPSGTQPFWAHKLIRDDKGQVVKVVLDESKQRIFDDLAVLILEGVSFGRLGEVLYERGGHLDPRTGKPYLWNYFYIRIHNPGWWGHAARYWNKKGHAQAADLWALGEEFEEHYPPPETTIIWRNVLPAVWPGELGERLKSELVRRRDSAHGKAYAQNMYRYTGLIICHQCGLKFSYSGGEHNGYKYMYCNRHRGRVRFKRDCENSASLNEEVIQAWLHVRLSWALQMGQVQAAFVDDSAIYERALNLTRRDLEITQKQITRLSTLIATADDDLVPDLQQQLQVLNQQRKELRRIESQHNARLKQMDTTQQQHALEELRLLTLEKFWELPPNQINQLLHRLFGRKRMVADNGNLLDSWFEPPSKSFHL